MVFSGSLDSTVKQCVELVNPTSFPISYSPEIIINSLNQFNIKSTENDGSVSVSAKAQVTVPVLMKAKFTRSSDGYILFRSKIMTFNRSFIHAFQVVSEVDSGQPRQLYTMDVSLYQINRASSVQMDIKNPFDKTGNFLVELRESGSQRAKPITLFTANKKKIAIDGDSTASLVIDLAPVEIGVHSCAVHFIDEKIGEFTYKIEATIGLPLPSEKALILAGPSAKVVKTLQIPYLNPMRAKALEALSHGLDQVEKSSPSSQFQTLKEWPDPVKYKISYSSPFFMGPVDLILGIAKNHRKKGSSESEKNTLPVTFSAIVSIFAHVGSNCLNFFRTLEPIRVVLLARRQTPVMYACLI